MDRRRKVQDISPSDRQHTMILLARSASAGEYVDLVFNDESLSYLGKKVAQDFRYVLIDNTGNGSIRVAYNEPNRNLTAPADGAKTLFSLNSLYIEEKVESIRIYFIADSSVELVLLSDKKV